MTIQEIHSEIDRALRKSQVGYKTPEEKDAAINWAQDEYFERLKPAFGLNQQVNDALLPFKKEQSFTNGTSPDGVITLNSDYYHLLAIKTQYMDGDDVTHNKLVEFIGEDQLDRLDSQLIPVTVENPLGRLLAPSAAYGQYRFKLYPEQASAGTVFYLRRPAKVVFGYSISGRTVTYNSGTSTQIEWNDAATRKIIELAVERLSMTLQDIPNVQYSQSKAQQP